MDIERINFTHIPEQPSDQPSEQQRPAMIAGLDLGLMQDYSALCILERHGSAKKDFKFLCRYLRRWELRTKYSTIVSDTANLMNSEQMQSGDGKPMLAVDATGVGSGVIETIQNERMKANVRPIQIVGGATESRDGDIRRVPKKDLISAAQVALQNGALKIASTLPDAGILVGELENYKVKITDAGNDVFGEWRTGHHDDLVLSLCLALWSGINIGTGIGVFV